MTSKFHNCVALVTGASRGIGFAIAERLVVDGAHVCITGRDSESLDRAVDRLGRAKVIGVPGRSDDNQHRKLVVSRIGETFGRLDVLVNNVGINPSFGPLVDIDLDAARKTAEVNIVGTLGWIQDVIRDQRLGFRGVIVNVSSISSSTVLPGIAFYGATKSAVEGLTRSLAVELAPHVRINAVAPAVVETEFSRVLHEKRNAAEEGYLLHRFGHTEDVASAVAFLASAESSWITGQTLILDGGLSVGGVRR